MDLVAGQMVGPYRLVERAGGGGMGVVWRALHPQLERHVAIKFISPQYAADSTFLDRFQREARAVSRLDHSNILAVYDYGEQEGWTYMVSPFIGGGTLAARLRDGIWTVEEALAVLQPLTSALDYAHSEGIIHRDVKPDNIMFTERGRLVLTDFGIARLMEASTLLSHSGLIIGTPIYMSPEQAEGRRVGPASDLYSVGILAYQMLTGRPPFVADTPIALLRAHIDKPPPPPRSSNPALSDAEVAALSRVLAKEPANRFPSGAAFVRALAAGRGPVPVPDTPGRNPTQHSEPTQLAPLQNVRPGLRPTPPTNEQRTPSQWASGRLSRRHAVLALGALITTGVGVGLTAYGFAGQWLTGGVFELPGSGTNHVAPNVPPTVATAPTSASETQTILDQPGAVATTAPPRASVQTPAPTGAVQAGIPTTQGVHPPGQWILVMRTEGGANDLFMLTPGGTPRRLTGPTPNNRWSWAPTISPDGRRVAFNHGAPGRSDIVVMAIDGSSRSVVATSTDTAQWGSPSWRPDGTVTFHGSQDRRDGIFQTSTSGSPSLITTGGGVAEPLLPTWPHTDGPLAFAGKDGQDWRIWVLANDGTARAISLPGVDSYAPAWSPDGRRIAFQGGGAGIVTTAGDGSDRRVVVPTQTGMWFHAPAWSPDSQWIAYVAGRQDAGISQSHGDLWTVPAQGGTPTRVTTTGTVYDWRPAWAP